jgi:hypothetical protein
MEDPTAEMNEFIRRRLRGDEKRERWADEVRAQADRIAEEGAASRAPNGGWDPGARTPPPSPPPSMNTVLRRSLGRQRHGYAGAYDDTYAGVDDDLPPVA